MWGYDSVRIHTFGVWISNSPSKIADRWAFIEPGKYGGCLPTQNVGYRFLCIIIEPGYARQIWQDWSHPSSPPPPPPSATQPLLTPKFTMSEIRCMIMAPWALPLSVQNAYGATIAPESSASSTVLRYARRVVSPDRDERTTATSLSQKKYTRTWNHFERSVGILWRWIARALRTGDPELKYSCSRETVRTSGKDLRSASGYGRSGVASFVDAVCYAGTREVGAFHIPLLTLTSGPYVSGEFFGDHGTGSSFDMRMKQHQDNKMYFSSHWALKDTISSASSVCV